MATYRNPANTARATAVARPDRIAEAGEVFTPQSLVDHIIALPEQEVHVVDPQAYILEPAAGDGNFVVPVLRRRLTALLEQGASEAQLLEAASRVYAVELQPDNVAIMRERVRALWAELVPGLSRAGWARVEELGTTRLMEGNFLTRHACLLPCPPACTDHEALALPPSFALALGNPPYNPGAVYKDFVLACRAVADQVCFIVPTAWKLSDTHGRFREALRGSLVSVTDLPWDTFAIKLRTCILTVRSDRTDPRFLLNGVETELLPDRARVANSILAKAYGAWPGRLEHHQVSGPDPARPCLFMGWKTNLERGKGRINAVQSLATDRKSKLLPNNVFTFAFASEKERDACAAFTATKLAAYLQSLTDSDTVARILPLPPLDRGARYRTHDDEFLYRQLKLTRAEIAQIEAYALFISGKAKAFYDGAGVPVRPDALIGKERRSCPSCGSSSFHRKGCALSTAKERELRDRPAAATETELALFSLDEVRSEAPPARS